MTPLTVSSPLAVCVLPERPPNAARSVACPGYIHEILAHAGLCYTTVSADELADRLPGLRLLLTVGEGTLPEAAQSALRAWVEQGGAWLAVAGVCGLESLFGVEPESPTFSGWGAGLGTLGEGYAEGVDASHPAVAHLDGPLHYFNGLPVRAAGARVLARVLDAHQRPTERLAVAEADAGRGRCLLIAPDVTGTVVRVQQGVGVTRDGVSAPDGTAPIGDDVLKSGDGAVLDWIFDRQPVSGVPGLQGFLRPVADLWREVLLRSIFHLATRQNVALPLLWFYPRNLPGLAHMSHDTDGNDPEKCVQLLATLEKAGIHSTWCTILPGYSFELMSRIHAAGHEYATHYDAMTEGLEWSEAQFDRQWRELVELFGGTAPVTNKNHYLRWEGDCELFDWCVRRGIQLDQSKGASKAGEFGYNFGTCHLYFPVRMNGEVIDILEMATPTQDLEVFVPAAAAPALLDTVERHYGVFHLLFHPAHIDKPGVADSIVGAVAQAKARGFEWWTAEQINNWERARRRVRWSGYAQDQNGVRVTLSAEEPLAGATVLWLDPAGKAAAGGDAESVERWGFRFRRVTLDLAAGAPVELTGPVAAAPGELTV